MLIIAYAHFLYKASFRFLVFGAVSERNSNTQSGGFRLCVFLNKSQLSFVHFPHFVHIFPLF